MSITTIYFVNVGQCNLRQNYHVAGSYRRMKDYAKGRKVQRARISYDIHADCNGTTNEKIARQLVAYLERKGLTDVGAHVI